MAGVGPFSVPAAKRGARVFANDLNPACYDAINNNMKLNKVISYYNIDGKFIIKLFFFPIFSRISLLNKGEDNALILIYLWTCDII